MNPKVLCCLVGLLAVSGCGRSAESRYLLEAMKAYQAGDVAALRSAAKRFGAAYPRDARAMVGCTPEAFRARRMDLYRRTLARLDQPTVLAMAEEARLIHFQDGGIAAIAEEKLIDLEKVCGRKDPDLVNRANEDILARVAGVEEGSRLAMRRPVESAARPGRAGPQIAWVPYVSLEQWVTRRRRSPSRGGQSPAAA
jgi:hypothetical protein